MTYVGDVEAGLQQDDLGEDEQRVEAVAAVVRAVDGHGGAETGGAARDPAHEVERDGGCRAGRGGGSGGGSGGGVARRTRVRRRRGRRRGGRRDGGRKGGDRDGDGGWGRRTGGALVSR